MPLSEEQIDELKGLKKTPNLREFAQMRQHFPERVTIVSEGDSWFAYPPKWIIAGKPSNLISHISSMTYRKANFLAMASNGDEAVDMVSGQQKHKLVNVLRWHNKGRNRKPVDLLLFSGGGNDIVGKNDFERFLNPAGESYTTAEECVNLERLNRKTTQISLAYQELLDIRDHYSPETTIMTHTYDYPYPSLTGAEFLGGLIQTKGWMKRFMDAVNIKDELQVDVIKIFMDAMATGVLNIADERDGFVVIDTRGVLKGKKRWLNEIHPTSTGFKELARLIYAKMKEMYPTLD